MRTMSLMLLALLVACGTRDPAAAPPAEAPSAASVADAADAQAGDADRAAIRRAALDYIEGWYTKDPARMERALHPQMVKRRTGVDAQTQQSYFDDGDASRLIEGTRPVPGRPIPPLERERREVTILDIYGNAASVKVDATGWVDYLHLVKWNGEWKIVNVLWELRPGQ